MTHTPSTEETYWIDDPGQLGLLTSAARQAIFDGFQALGACSVADLARELGVPADALYYHVRKMVKAGLLVEQGTRGTARRDEAVYALASPNMRVRYDASDPENVRLLGKAVSAMLQTTQRDFRDGFTPARAVVDGDGRNLWAARLTAWLTEEELGEVNALLERLRDLLRTPRRPGPRQLYAVTWVLAPKEDQPIRR